MRGVAVGPISFEGATSRAKTACASSEPAASAPSRKVDAACPSRSQSRVLRDDKAAAAQARLTAMLVLPTPPLRL